MHAKNKTSKGNHVLITYIGHHSSITHQKCAKMVCMQAYTVKKYCSTEFLSQNMPFESIVSSIKFCFVIFTLKKYSNCCHTKIVSVVAEISCDIHHSIYIVSLKAR